MADSIRDRAQQAARLTGEDPDSDAFLAFVNGYQQALESLLSDVLVVRENTASRRVRSPVKSVGYERAGAVDALNDVVRLIQTGDVE